MYLIVTQVIHKQQYKCYFLGLIRTIIHTLVIKSVIIHNKLKKVLKYRKRASVSISRRLVKRQFEETSVTTLMKSTFRYVMD